MMSKALEEKHLDANYASPVLKWAAVFISYVFHPVFIPLYAIWFLVYIHPSYFSGFSAGAKKYTIFIAVYNLIFYPLLSVLLLKAVGFIDSIFLKTKKDRIIPYMACGIFFFWGYTIFKEQGQYPGILPSFIFGIFLASSGALLANIYFKISMHAIAMGGLTGLFIIITNSNTMLMSWPLSLVLLISGLVCTARLLVSDHQPKDIYSGIFTGLLSQFIAAFVMM